MLQEQVPASAHGLEHANRRRLPSDIEDSLLLEGNDR